MPYTREQLDKMFERLPNDIQEAVTSDGTIACLKEIEKEHHLKREQVKELSAEIGMLMLGASSPQQFIPNIEKSAGISNETAKLIASKVNEKIFRPVKESLKNLHVLDKNSSEVGVSEPISLKKDDEKKEEKKPEILKKEYETKELPKMPDLYREPILKDVVAPTAAEKTEEKKIVPTTTEVKKDFPFVIPKKSPEPQKEAVKEPEIQKDITKDPEKPADPYRETV
jgi:hypothetical protein